MGDRKASGSKEDLKKFKEEIVHQFHVVSEGVIDQVKLVAEGVTTINERLEAARKELKEEIDNKTQPIVQAVVELSGKVVALDGKVATLDGKVVALDGKVDRVHQELKTEIQSRKFWQPLSSPMRNWTNGLQPSKKNFLNSNIVWKK